MSNAKTYMFLLFSTFHHIPPPRPNDSPNKQDQIDGCDAFLVIYSVVDKASFTRAEYFLTLLQDMDLLRSRCCILVGNKIDLARSRAISSQGKA